MRATRFIALVLFACILSRTAVCNAAEPGPAKVLIVVGPSGHPPGTHEVAAGARLIAYCLEHAPGMKFDVRVVDGWPQDESVLRDVATVVFSGDQFPLEKMKNSRRNLRSLGAMMDRGCGIVCYHYATGVLAGNISADGSHPLLQWTGGCFSSQYAKHRGVARIMKQVTITPKAKGHPIMRGVSAFTVDDEPYFNNYFGPNGMTSNVTALATSMLPPEAPREEVVAWAIQRADGGRGMGIVVPHFFKNWKIDDLRAFVLNGIVWTANQEVPAKGVQVALPALETFKPAAVEPGKKKWNGPSARLSGSMDS